MESAGHIMSKTSKTETSSPVGTGLMARIAHLMIARDIPALPRNFELIHAAIAADNPTLSRELSALGAAPAQSALDALGLAHGLASHAVLAVGQRAADALAILDRIAREIDAERRGKAAALQELEDGATRLSDNVDETAGETARLVTLARDLAERDAEHGRRIDDLLARMKVLRAGLTADHATLTHDPATGLANRTALSNRLAALYSEDNRSAAALVAIRIPALGNLVATHVAGGADEALTRLAGLLRRAVKKDDFVARTGTDHFAVLLSDVDRAQAHAIIERIASRIAAEPFLFAGREFPAGTLRANAGFALSDAAASAGEFQRQAEQALASALDTGAELRAYSADVAARMAPAYGRGVA